VENGNRLPGPHHLAAGGACDAPRRHPLDEGSGQTSRSGGRSRRARRKDAGRGAVPQGAAAGARGNPGRQAGARRGSARGGRPGTAGGNRLFRARTRPDLLVLYVPRLCR